MCCSKGHHRRTFAWKNFSVGNRLMSRSAPGGRDQSTGPGTKIGAWIIKGTTRPRGIIYQRTVKPDGVTLGKRKSERAARRCCYCYCCCWKSSPATNGPLLVGCVVNRPRTRACGGGLVPATEPAVSRLRKKLGTALC